MKIGIIGGGPAGYIAAIRASQFGSKVTLIEKEKLGGTCLNKGCIPTKSLIENTGIWSTFKNSSLFSEYEVEQGSKTVPWKQLFKSKNEVTDQLRMGIQHLMKKSKVNVIYGVAKIKNKNEVEVVSGNEKQTFHFDTLIIATGSIPVTPPIPGINENDNVFTSDELLTGDFQMESITIIGGGVIGLEFATIYKNMGLEVTIIEAEEEILLTLDPLIRETLYKELIKKGVRLFTNTKVERIKRINENKQIVQLNNGEEVVSSHILLATGRKTNIETLGLNEAGIIHENGRILVNSSFQTSYKNVYAVGDCSSKMMLAHVAMKEAVFAVEHAHTGVAHSFNYNHVPQVIYTDPEAAGIGLTLNEAVQLGYKANEKTFPLMGNGRAMIHRNQSGFVKLISEEKYGQVLGCHMVGPHVSELVNQLSIALHLEATVDELCDVIFAHPTVSESINEAALMAKGINLHV